MKKRGLYLMFSAVITALFLFVACEGPAGPEGPAGLNGSDGTDGVDGNAVCLTCHNLTNKAAKDAEYALSVHGIGANVAYAGGRQGCAMCHSSEGFIETQFTGQDTTNSAAGIAYPSAIGCATCHDFHSTFDFENDGEDFALRTNSPIDLLMVRADGKPAKTVDFGGSNNLCVNCHQPRRVGPVADADDSFFISSSHWGPHHGPQSTSLLGYGMAEIAGAESYPAEGSHTHFKEAGCVGCHMGESGDHTWHVSLDNCKVCHTDATSMDIGGVQTEVAGLLHDLQVKLQGIGVVDAAGHLVKGKYSFKVAQAAYNYAWLEDDRSEGVHNPDYIIAILKNTIAAI